MKIGHRHGERHGKEGCVLLFPLKWPHKAVAQWKKIRIRWRLKWHGPGKLQDFEKNGFIHFYILETYKWGCSQSKFTYKDSL